MFIFISFCVLEMWCKIWTQYNLHISICFCILYLQP